MIDPDYIPSYLIKCQIYEDTCEYTMCLRMAKWALERCDSDDDEEDCIMQLEELIQNVEEKLPNEISDKEEYLAGQTTESGYVNG